jgi:hypothetical protein
LEKILEMALGASLEKFRGQRLEVKSLEAVLGQFLGEPRGMALMEIRAQFRDRFRGLALE